MSKKFILPIRLYRETLDSLMTKLSTPVVSTAALQEQMELKVYPNPAGDNVTLELSSPDRTKVDVVLQNSAGQVMRTLRKNWSIRSEGSHITLKLNNLDAGAYWIVVKGEGILLTRPLQIVK